jgi:hypothetical protein
MTASNPTVSCLPEGWFWHGTAASALTDILREGVLRQIHKPGRWAKFQ